MLDKLENLQTWLTSVMLNEFINQHDWEGPFANRWSPSDSRAAWILCVAKVLRPHRLSRPWNGGAPSAVAPGLRTGQDHGLQARRQTWPCMRSCNAVESSGCWLLMMVGPGRRILMIPCVILYLLRASGWKSHSTSLSGSKRCTVYRPAGGPRSSRVMEKCQKLPLLRLVRTQWFQNCSKCKRKA